MHKNNATQNTITQRKLAALANIYDRQHYFIDRHEVMAEKILTLLMIMGGLVAVTFSINRVQLSKTLFYPGFITLELCFLLFFLISLYMALRAIRPLSSKALKRFDRELLPDAGKEWVKHSLLYHRGILNLIEKCHIQKTEADSAYLSALTDDNLASDYVRQIFILAYYSNYKRVQLEEATKSTLFTLVLGVASLIACVLPIS